MKKIIIILSMFLMCTVQTLAEEEHHSTTIKYEVLAHVVFNNEDVIFSQDVHVNDHMTEPSHIDKEGYTFLGWFNGNSKWDFTNDVVTEHMTLTARYVKNGQPADVINATDPANNDLNASLDFKKDDLYLTSEEEEILNNGDVILVELTVDQIDENTIAQDIKDMLLDKAEAENGIWLDINLIKTVNGTSDYIRETKNKVKITITIPEEIRNENRIYSIYREHNNVAEKVFEGKTEENWQITFETDKFSIYLITYREAPSAPSFWPKPKPVENTAAVYSVEQYTNSWLKLISMFIMALCVATRRRKN